MQGTLAMLLVCTGLGCDATSHSDVAPYVALQKCERTSFDAQAHQLLADKMMSPEEARAVMFNVTVLQDTLRTRWADAELFVYGSLVIGLGLKNSDVDLFARIPNYNVTADKYVVKEVAKLLNKQPERYDNITLHLNLTVAAMSFNDISLGRWVDLSFGSNDGIPMSNMLAYYMNLDKRHTSLAALIKLWCKAQLAASGGRSSNYAIYMMIVFYLQQKNMSPAGFDIQAGLPPRMIKTWNFNYREISYNVQNNESLYVLLGGFFKYYSEFNFEMYCVSPYVGRAILKSDLQDLSSIPDELVMLKNKLGKGETSIRKLNTDVCIQNMFEHDRNAVTPSQSKHIITLISQIKAVGKMYDELPSDQFLRFLFHTGGHNELIQCK